MASLSPARRASINVMSSIASTAINTVPKRAGHQHNEFEGWINIGGGDFRLTISCFLHSLILA
jgi:hypothetical protein